MKFSKPGLLVALVCLLAGLSKNDVFSQSNSFICDGKYYLTQYNSNNLYTEIVNVEFNNSAASFVPVHNIPYKFNATAYNWIDNNLYGFILGNKDIIRVSGDGTYTNLGTPINYPPAYGYTAGDFTKDGTYVLSGGNSPYILKVDVSGTTPVVIDSIEKYYVDGSSANNLNFDDIAIHPVTQRCYGFDKSTHKMVEINIHTGAVKIINDTISYPSMITLGGLFFSIKGDLYGYQTNQLYIIDTDMGIITPITSGPNSTNRDACACPYSLDLLVDADLSATCSGNTITYTYTLINNTDEAVYDITLHNDLPENHIHTNNPVLVHGGNVISGMNSSTLHIENLTIPVGEYSFEVIVQAPIVNSTIEVGSQSYLTNTIVTLPDTIFSDDPATYFFNDSTLLTLHAITESITHVEEEICISDSIFLAGAFQTVSGVYTDTFQATLTCDSIVITNLTVHSPEYVTVYDTICEGTAYTLPGGDVVYNQGIYTDTTYASFMCGTITTTHLTVSPTYLDTIYTSICDGDSYLLPDGNLVNSGGTYSSHLYTNSGCDSTIITELLVHTVYQTTIEASICEGESYVLPNGSFVAAAGTYIDTFSSISGCDSIIITQLNIYPTFVDTIQAAVCEGDEYLLPNGNLVSAAGEYTSYLQSEHGCDSIIHTVLAVIHTPPILNLLPDTTFCTDEEIKRIDISHYGGLYYQWNTGDIGTYIDIQNPGTYIVSIEQNSGCVVNDTIQVSFEDCSFQHKCSFHLPTAFSPNNDGVNDRLCVLSNCKEYVLDYFEFSLHNRWGEVIFRTNNPTDSWDGMYRGDKTEGGVYIYNITYGDHTFQKIEKGTVTLVR